MVDSFPSYLFVLIGPSGVGKSTILRYLESRFGVESSPKYTTRPSRNTEEDARDFIHCTHSNFPTNNILVFESYGHLFGIQLNSIAESFRKGKAHVTIVGSSDTVLQLSAIYGDKVVVMFIFCDFMVLRDRIMASSDVLRTDRWVAICNEIDNIYHQLKCVDFVVNNSKSIDETFRQIDTIINRLTLAPST
jgi:guanylate kinase